MEKKNSLFDVILNIVIVLLAVLIIFWLIQLIFGGSPGLSEFNFGIIILMAGVLFKVYREMGEIRVEIKYSFMKVKEDMNLIKRKLEI